MINMQEHANKLKAVTIFASVNNIETTTKPFIITLDNQQILKAHTVILATGATPNRLNCPGEQEFWGKGVSTCAVCDGAFYHNQNIIVVGGGDSSMENASFLSRNNNKITIVHIGDKLTASHAMQQRVLNKPGF